MQMSRDTSWAGSLRSPAVPWPGINSWSIDLKPTPYHNTSSVYSAPRGTNPESHMGTLSTKLTGMAWCIKVKVPILDYRAIGFRSWSRFLAVSLQVVWVINQAVCCHYFLPGLQLPPQPLRALLPILLLCEQRHDGCEKFTRQRRDCDLNPGPSAPESSTLTTRLPSHFDGWWNTIFVLLIA